MKFAASVFVALIVVFALCFNATAEEFEVIQPEYTATSTVTEIATITIDPEEVAIEPDLATDLIVSEEVTVGVTPTYEELLAENEMLWVIIQDQNEQIVSLQLQLLKWMPDSDEAASIETTTNE